MSQNYEGPRTAYGDAYHGYWIADATQLNARFGTADDLKALSDELHRRGMYAAFPSFMGLPTPFNVRLPSRYLMVDVVVNNVMAKATTTPDLSTYMFKEQASSSPHRYGLAQLDYFHLSPDFI